MKFAVVGTGVIGSGWITRILAHGHEVIATDPSDGAYERMLTQVKQNWPYAKVMITPDNFPNRAIMMPKGIPIIDANNTPYTDIRK